MVLTCLVFGTDIFASRVDTVQVYSKTMQKYIPCVFVTPSKIKQKQSYPVVYLLHGFSGNYAQWITDAPQLTWLADVLRLIFVCPDGGYGSWYFDSPVDSSFRYETFIANELTAFTDTHFPTIQNKQGRAITGLSMGGHGGLYLSMRHPDIFGAGGSICGGVDFRPFPANWDLVKRLGDTACCWKNWEQNTVMAQLDKARNASLELIIDCGLDDFFLPVNRALHQQMVQMQIPHDYIERPGSHNRDYWRNAIDYQALFFSNYFRNGNKN